jgi:hypothetical protein
MPSGESSEWERIYVKKERKECLGSKYPVGLYGRIKRILSRITGDILEILSSKIKKVF